MITQSESIGKLSGALIKAQMQFEPIIKDAKAYKNKFAPLPACHKATWKALHDNDLVIMQPINILDNHVSILETILSHTSSGEFIKSHVNLTELMEYIKEIELLNFSKDPKNKMPNLLHDWGSIVTYTRRYAYLSIIGAVSEDEDEDGYMHTYKKNGNGNNQNPDYEILKQSLIKDLFDLIKESGCDVAAFAKHYNISRDDILNVKRSIDNFDELLIKFKDSNRIDNPNMNGTDGQVT